MPTHNTRVRAGLFASSVDGGGAEGNGVLAGKPNVLMQPIALYRGSYFDFVKAYDEQAGMDVVLQVVLRKGNAKNLLDIITAFLAAAHNNFPDTVDRATGPRFRIIRVDYYRDMPCMVLPHYQQNIMQAVPGTAADVLYSWLADVAEDLSRLHSEGRIHGAITPGKILIDEVTNKAFINGVVSYELERILEPERILMRADFVLEAPEILEADDPQVTKASDVFQFGMTMYRVLGGDVRKPPRRGKLVHSLEAHVKGQFRLKKPSCANPEIFNQVLRATALNPANRPTMKDLAHALRAIAGG